MGSRPSALAALMLLACLGCGGGGAEKEPIRIGLLAPLTGRADFIGTSFERVAETAILSINDNGGVDGHELVLVKRDTESDEDQARRSFIELAEDEGVVSIVGPALSDSVLAAHAEAKRLQIPFISPSSTAASLIDLDDGGFLFRNVPNDNFQGLAQAYFLTTEMAAGPGISSAAVLHETGEYGTGLASSFETAFESCSSCDIPDTHVVAFEKNLANQAAADDVLDRLVALSPEPEWIIVVAVVEDGIKLMTSWDPGNGPARLSNTQWFMTDGLRLAGFLERIPASMVGMMGTAPTVPETGNAYDVLRAAYGARNTDNLDDQVFAANVWDAYYLLAAGLLQQARQDASFGGSGLRDAIRDVSRGPGQIFHAGQYAEMAAAILSGSQVDYDGAAGPNDFDDTGETLGPYEVWRIANDGAGGYTFERVIFLSTSLLQSLAN